MKNECSIVRDLLPLYVEKMVSEDTAEFIKEHLDGCVDCRKICESYSEPQKIETSGSEKDNDPAPLINIKKKLRAKRIRAVVITAVVIIGLVVGMFAVSAKYFSEWYRIAGYVTDVTVDSSGKLASFVVEDSKGKKSCVTLDEETIVFCLPESFAANKFLEGEIEKATVTVEYNPFSFSFTEVGGSRMKTYSANIVDIDSFFTGETVTLSDGTEVEKWRHTFFDSYNLPNGVNLMYDYYKIFSGTNEVDGLTDEAEVKIVDYITSEGVVFDKFEVLEDAYEEYLRDGSRDYGAYTVGQETRLSLETEEVLYFVTVANRTVEGENGVESRVSTAVDRETGEVIEASELLACSRQEAIEKLMDIAEIKDEEERKLIAESFSPENILFYQASISVETYAEGLDNTVYEWGIGLYYEDVADAGIFKDWVFPEFVRSAE
ncbi:MAG: zf-HC2 domain-containing protein [Oscillospiraceae bacterium]|nr:zf-HC2 domain-containing protein [Oscillospiraceae bacterium]